MKILAFVFLFLFLASLSPVFSAQPYVDQKGDVNNDGQINVLDVLSAINHILGTVTLDKQGSWRADCNGSEGICDGDGVINIIDALKIVNIILGSDGCSGTTVTDIDGNVYHTVTIGTLVWMVENLKTTRYRNGDPMPEVTGNSQWAGLSNGAYCNYDNDANNAGTYGRLFNWYAVDDSRKIAPAGWHVPTDDDWKKLEMYLGMSQSEADDVGHRGTDEGGKLKETGTTHWNGPNLGATNASGFEARPGGFRYGHDGSFSHMGSYAFFWSATDDNVGDAWRRLLVYNDSGVYRDPNGKSYGFSIRCVRD